MKCWFIVFEWWPSGGDTRRENKVWMGEHPLDCLEQMRTANDERENQRHHIHQNYRLLWWEEIDEARFFKWKEML